MNNIRKTISFKTIGLVTFSSLVTYELIKQYPGYFLTIPKFEPMIKFDEKQNIEKNVNSLYAKKFTSAIEECREKMSLWKTIHGIPGYVVGVSIEGENVWIEGNGYADVENGTPCHSGTVMRIASISKSITATLLAKMVQDKKIDLDKSIYEYLKEDQFPRKQWEGENVDITLRQLAAHLGGIRHYKIDNNGKGESEFNAKEYYIKELFPNITQSLSLFKDDPLVAKPGTKFVYTTFGYTLLSAVMETQMESKNFSKELIKFIHKELGLHNTSLDQNDVIIWNRSRYYCHKVDGGICNVPYVDNSYKWAGGGLLSNIPDLLKFGNIMLYSFKGQDRFGRQGYLNQEIIDEMWRPLPNTNPKSITDTSKGYGIGFFVVRDGKALKAFTAEPPFENFASHSGGAVGASSILLIEPKHEIIVSVITNFQEVKDISLLGLQIAEIFSKPIKKVEEIQK